MNPFSTCRNSISDIKVMCTNIRSLRISKKELTARKIEIIIDLHDSINILIDMKVTDVEANEIFNNDFLY